MSQNNDQGRPNPSQPWYDNGQEPQTKRFPFGANGGQEPAPQPQNTWQPGPQFGSGRDGQNAQQPTPPYGQPPVQQGQPQQGQPQPPQFSNSGPQYTGPGNQDAGQQPPQSPAPYDGQNQQYQNPNQQYQGQQYPVQGDPPQGQKPFQGILDPHTGEIHPVPDLDGLQDTDALLVVVSGPDSGSQILLDTDVVTVGRSPNADIFLDDVTVSRKHAEFIRTPSGFTLRDTGSLNGTYVGRQLIDSIELQNGADVQIGKFRMIFQQRPRS